MTRKMNSGLKVSGDKPSTEPSSMLQEYLGSDGVITDRLLNGVNHQEIIARYGRVKDEVNSLVAIISQTPHDSNGKA